MGLIASLTLVATAAAQENAPPPPYDVSRLARGSDLTVVALFAVNCAPCQQELSFYRELLQHPNVDGKRVALVVVATDGVGPVHDVLRTAGVTPHRLTSGPYPGRSIDGLQAPAMLILSAKGEVVQSFKGVLTPDARTTVLRLIGS